MPGIPNNLYVQTANQQVLVSWDQTAGATSYLIQRSLDNVTFTALATVSGSPLATSYLDTAVTLGTQYFYTVAASDGTTTSPYTASQSAIPTQTGEMSLQALRLSSQQKADLVNSGFVTLPEWNKFINLAMFELYDLLVTVYEDYYVAEPVTFNTVGGTYRYALPNGSNSFQNQAGATITPPAYYKLLGVDMKLNTVPNAWITINKFNFIDRNKWVYPAAGTTIYGVYNAQYRVMGDKIEFIPIPSGGQSFQLWYIPRLQELLQDTDVTTTGISGWIEYVIVRAAMYALAKEESDITGLQQELMFLKQRIEESAANRDAGQPDTISNTRSSSNIWGTGPGWTGSGAGW